jgi:hypothetical protein
VLKDQRKEGREIMASMKTMMLVLMTILFGLSFISQPSYAEIYKWVDEKGTVHFTEDPATIPEKYKEEFKSRTTEEDLMTPEQKAREKKRYEDEVRERLKKENREYDPKEYEKRVKEIEDQAKKQREEGKCEIISYSQQNTCVDLVIRNNDREPKTITERNIIATTSKKIVTKWTKSGKPDETKDRFNPRAVFIQIRPGETYRGSICFHRQLPIAKLELQGL